MNWGRYAEIFDYDRERGRLVQTELARWKRRRGRSLRLHSRRRIRRPYRSPEKSS